MEELANNPLFMDLVAASIFLAFACQGLVRGLYKQIMPFLVVVLAGIGAVALSASLTGPVTEIVYPKVVDALLGAYEDSGVDFTRVSLEAVERLSDLVPQDLLEKLDETERSGALGQAVTEMFSDASGKGLGTAVNDALAAIADSGAGRAAQGAAAAAGQYGPGAAVAAGAAVDQAMDAVREGVVGDAIDSALDAAADGAAGDAVNDAIHDIRTVVVRSVEVRTAAYVRLILLSLLWTGLMAALTVIKNTFQLAAKLPVVKQADRLGGAALGLAECALIFWAAAWLAKHVGFTWLAERAAGTRFLSLFV